MFAHCLEQPTRTASLTSLLRRYRLATIGPRCRPYSVLLPVGFALPPPLPAARCALTAPFHPYPASPCGFAGRFVLCGTFPGVIPACAENTPPDVIRHRMSMEPGLSSPLRERPSGRLTG